MHTFAKLPTHIAAQLAAIEQTGDGYGPVYHPCRATLLTGATLECVYVCEAKSWFEWWGVWPDEDWGKRDIDIATVQHVEPSKFALPARFANQLYAAGESGMGYTLFTVEFADGTDAAYGTGNAVDFIIYPEGKSAKDVVGVTPHAGRARTDRRSCPDYVWCLYFD